MRTTTTLDKDEHSTLCYDDKVRRATIVPIIKMCKKCAFSNGVTGDMSKTVRDKAKVNITH